MRLSASLSFSLILVAIGAGLVPVIAIGFGQGYELSRLFDAYFFRVVTFTIVQATLSTVFSVLFAIPVARTLARRQFPGRGLVLRLFALPLALPAIVAILGIVEIYGRSGWLSRLTALELDIYGLAGILIAHVFFNMPLAARMMLVRLDQIAPESFRLSAQLGFGAGAFWRFIEWPAIRETLPGIASLVFLLCAASFATVLTLGGGPQATTLEVAIYQALRYDFDPARASLLSMAQLALCVPLVALTAAAAGRLQHAPALRAKARRFATDTAFSRLADGGILAVALAFVFLPLIALVLAGIGAPFAWSAIAGAMITSLFLAGGAMLLSLLLAWPLANAAARGSPLLTRLLSTAALLAFIVPPAVLATGWFVLALKAGDPPHLAPLLVIVMNALMALPFGLSVLTPAVSQSAARHDRLCAGLGLSGFARLRLIDLPVLARPLGLAAALSFAISLGDLTAITLFGSQDLTTLPALVYRQMGSYRLDAAAGSALVLAVFSTAIIAMAERWR
ncbi:MAG: thiamine/thiamine pyrophosphate ABC transporter permease ThiP [Rhizobiales bacterium]|nr:thiamine/thiamine pyrophosphate ABC transporter permease ThiP [Hyphomicrobiales bacterium]